MDMEAPVKLCGISIMRYKAKDTGPSSARAAVKKQKNRIYIRPARKFLERSIT